MSKKQIPICDNCGDIILNRTSRAYRCKWCSFIIFTEMNRYNKYEK